MTFQFFRTFNKALCASRFTKPNNIFLGYCDAPTYLCTSDQPIIDYPNTVGSLIKTINKLNTYLPNKTYHKIIQQELVTLNNHLQRYRINCIKFVENGGRITAQGLANLYTYSNQLKIDDHWLNIYVQVEVPNSIRNMSEKNLIGLINGLKNNKVIPQFIELAQKQLKSRLTQTPVYVKRRIHQITEFEQMQEPKSKNLLIRSIQNNRAIYQYQFLRLYNYYIGGIYSNISKRPGGYALDE